MGLEELTVAELKNAILVLNKRITDMNCRLIQLEEKHFVDELGKPTGVGELA